MWKIILLCSVVVLEVSGVVDKKFVSFGGVVCPKEDKALGRCLRDALNALIPQLANGMPQYGIPASEPLLVPSITIEQSSGPIAVTSVYTDVSVSGPSSMKIRDIHVDTKKKKIVARVHIPELKSRGKYKLTGSLLMLPIEGEGKFTGEYGDIDALITVELGRKHRHGAPDALACKELAVKFHVNQVHIQLDNLFGGDSELGTAMNNFLNQNWRELATELQQPMETGLKDFLKPLLEHAFSNINADEILWT